MAGKSLLIVTTHNRSFFLFVFFFKTEDLRQILVDALRRNYTDFIEIFLEFGINLETLTVEDLECLYKSAEVIFQSILGKRNETKKIDLDRQCFTVRQFAE